jgi:cell division protein FtsN
MAKLRKKSGTGATALFNQLKWLAVFGALIFFLAGILWALHQRETILANQPIPFIQPPNTPIKERPEQPGGLSFPHQQREIFDLLHQQQKAAEKAVNTPESAMPKKPEIIAEPTAVTPPVPQPAPAQPVEPAKTATDRAGNWGVQLASFINQRDAERAVLTYLERHSSHLVGLTPDVQAAEVNGTPRYRVRFLGLADKAAATELCATLKAAGQGCLHVTR